jgi:hypothetical protein
LAIVNAAELFTTRLALVKPERDIADDGLDVAALAIEVRPLEAYCRVAEYTRADCLSVALAAIEVRVLPDVRVLPAEDTVERATFLATPRLVFLCKPYAAEALAAAGRMFNLVAPRLIFAIDWRVCITGAFSVIGLLMLPVPDPRDDIRIAAFFNAFSALFAAAFLATCDAF